MTTQTRREIIGRHRLLQPIVPILAVLILAVVILYIGSFIASLLSQEAALLIDLRWFPYLALSMVFIYSVSILAPQLDIWRIDRGQALTVAIGALLYGVLSWATNIIELPALSQVSLRPAIVVPIFFGIVFGPAAGFFSGFAGNVLGDALSGWGVFPIWDMGNGLIGLVAGLAAVFRARAPRVDVMTALVVAINLLVTVMILAYPDTENISAGGTVGGFWWVPLLVVALAIGVRLLLRGLPDLAIDTMWGALGIIVGVGFAAIADIWWDGYTFKAALLGEFAPAASSNLVNALILTPVVLIAWNTIRSQNEG